MVEIEEDSDLDKIKDQNEQLKKELEEPQEPGEVKVGSQNTDKRDSDEDFFMMAVLSLKMIHNDKYDDTNYCMYINA